MKPERELERHERILEQIKNAKTKAELPRVSLNDILDFLVNNVHFNKRKLDKIYYQDVFDAIIKHGTAVNPEVYNIFKRIIEYAYRSISELAILTKYNEIVNTGRIDYILEEIDLKNKKIEELNKKANKEAHKEIMAQIIAAYEVNDLPKVGLSELNRAILRNFTSNEYSRDFKVSDIRGVTEAYLRQASDEEITRVVHDTFSRYVCDKRMVKQIIDNLINDETIRYTVEEIQAKEKRKLEIYKLDHEETMENIRNAKRISQLPPDLSFSTVTKYLLGNSTIYTNDNRMESEDLKPLVELLFAGYKWEDRAVKDEISRIAEANYSDKPMPCLFLYDKFSQLPRTYYLVDEVKYSVERQKEFIARRSSKVNVYFIFNEKAPERAGKFYNCYISRNENLDLNTLIPPGMPIDAIEFYIQEHFDNTFKVAGGITLNRDETIGNISVFRPNDGTIGISQEEKAKMDEIADLDRAIEEKRRLIQALDAEIAAKQQTVNDIESKMKIGLINYEKIALKSQRELVEYMAKLKREYGIEETIEEIGGISYTYDKKD